jgi:hypothetical protein
MFECKRREGTKGWSERHEDRLQNSYSAPNYYDERESDGTCNGKLHSYFYIKAGDTHTKPCTINLVGYDGV